MTSGSSTQQHQDDDDYLHKETATLNWTIKSFSNLLNCRIRSDSFFSPNSENKFELCFTGKTNPDDIPISLFYCGQQQELLMRYRVSIMDENGKKQYTREYRWNFKKINAKQYQRINSANFICNNSFAKYLVKGSLILHCQVDVLKKVDHQVNLQNDYQSLLESSEFSDVVLLVKGKEFKAHKAILIARSDVFRAMFSQDFEEKKQNRVEITDLEVDVFEHLLRYIYTGKIPEKGEFGFELFVAADKYFLGHLKSICAQYLGSNLTTESVVKVLVIADRHNASELKLKCIEYINDNSSAVIATDEWNKLLSRPDLLKELYEKQSDVNKTKKRRTK